MKDTDLLCVNGTFTEDYLIWAAENKIKLPVENQIYSLREIQKHSNGEVGVLLNEIINPLVNPQMVLLPDMLIEPTFSINRFRTLAGLPLKKEEIENFVEI